MLNLCNWSIFVTWASVHQHVTAFQISSAVGISFHMLQDFIGSLTMLLIQQRKWGHLLARSVKDNNGWEPKQESSTGRQECMARHVAERSLTITNKCHSLEPTDNQASSPEGAAGAQTSEGDWSKDNLVLLQSWSWVPIVLRHNYS